MGILSSLAEWTLAVAGGLVSSILASQIYDGCPRAAKSIVRFAVSRLPSEKRERYSEEWDAHLNECEGKLAPLLAAAGCVIATWQMSRKKTTFEPARSEKYSILRRQLEINVKEMKKIYEGASRSYSTVEPIDYVTESMAKIGDALTEMENALQYEREELVLRTKAALVKFGRIYELEEMLKEMIEKSEKH
jgi:hypothetical protein